METFVSIWFIFAICVGSKPTVWDGDEKLKTLLDYMFQRSKPTVWDGDKFFWRVPESQDKVLSPPCGMETFA